MNALIANTSLPALVQRAADALINAKSSAEVLEARDFANAIYDAAKSAGRLARAKGAHDTLIAQVYRAQADAIAIKAKAEIRLADEIDAAQERKELSKQGAHVSDGNMRVADLGMSRKQIHEARQVRDAEANDPGVFERTAFGMADQGIEPTKARVKAEIAPAKSRPTMNPQALWLWGRLKDFERDGILRGTLADLLSEMTPEMRADAVRIAPSVAAFLLHKR